MHQPSRHVPIASSSGRYPPVVPLAPERYKLQVTIGGETLAKLRLVTDLLRHAVPSGDPAVVLDRALTVLAEDLLRKKAALRTRGRSRGTTADAEAVSPVSTPEVAALADGAASGSAEPSRAAEPGCREPVPTGPAPAVPSAAPTVARRASRHLPAAVLRGTWVRDQGRCAYVAPSGRRCGERAFLEFHHVVPFAVGGPATLDNVELRCRRHNAYEARLFFGGPA
jgi:hypothetical protein